MFNIFEKNIVCGNLHNARKLTYLTTMLVIYQIGPETCVIPLFRISLTPGSGFGCYFCNATSISD